MSKLLDQPIHPGTWVRQHVLPSKMTVTEAARRLGVGRPALSNFLNGRASLSQRMAQRLAGTFGADPAALRDLQARYDAGAATQSRQLGGGPFAPSVTTIRAAEIEVWANRIEARQRLAVLLRKLVHGSGIGVSRVDFPGYDSAERSGWDGWVATSGSTAWIPEGESGWEFSCSKTPETKANRDFNKRSLALDAEKQKLTLVFVTSRRWEGKRAWESAKKRLGLWKDVRAYDVDDLEQWIEQCVPVQVWFAEQLGRPVTGLVSLDQYWRRWAEATDPPLPRALFGPTAAEHSDAFREWLRRPGGQRFTIAADSRAEAVAFAACLMDEIQDYELAHRGVVFETSDAVRRLASSTRGALVAVAATPEAEQVFHEMPRALHGVVPVPRNRVAFLQTDPDVTLRLLGYKEFFAALAQMNLSHDEAVRLERDSGRSPTVLRRRRSRLPEVSTPNWANAEAAMVLGPLSLAGAWKRSAEADRKAVSRLANCDPERVESFVAEASGFDDPPVWSVGGYQGVVSRLDSFFATVDLWTSELLGRFFQIVQEVISEPDPALDLPEDQQWMAALHGKRRVHSSLLRSGLREALVILAVHGPHRLDGRLGLNTRARVGSVVENLLGPLDFDRLRSLNEDLPDLAEAAPDVFLDAVVADLDSDDSAVEALMRPAPSNVLSGGCSRAGLLWALERVAWEPDHYPRVVEILARLSAVEIDDNWAHKPEHSLRALFDPYYPQTSARLALRLQTIDALARRHRAVGWSVALGEKWRPPGGGPAHRSQLPAWRGDASAYRDSVSSNDAQRYIRAARETCLNWPQHNHQTLGGLVGIFPQLEPEQRSCVLQRIEAWEGACLPLDARAALADRVRGMRRLLKSHHPALRAELTPILKRLERGDPLAGTRSLFRSEWRPVYEIFDELEDDDFDEAERVVEGRRLNALRGIYRQDGFHGIYRLLDATNAHHVVARLMPDVLRDSAEREVFVMDCLDEREAMSAEKNETLLRAFVWRLTSPVIDALWRSVRGSDDPQKQRRFLLCLPYKQAKRLLRATTEDIRAAYWRNFNPRQYFSSDEKNELIDELLDADRPHAAFDVVVANWDSIQSSQLTRLIRAVGGTEAPSERPRQESRNFVPLFQSLGKRADVLEDEKARLEMMFFAALCHSPYPMPSLARRMAASPDIFVEAIARFFGRTDGRRDPPQLQSGTGEQRRTLARTALGVLEWFESVPGADDDGALALEALEAWIGEARSMLRHLGRAEIGDERIGRLLAKAGPDASGVWPRREICVVFEDIWTEDVEIGFVAGSLDRRGVWMRGLEEGGDQEQDLATCYRAWAASVAVEFPCVTRVLRNIAKHYDERAEHMDAYAELQRRGVK